MRRLSTLSTVIVSAIATAGVFLAGVYVASAGQGGATSGDLSFAGTLTDDAGPLTGPVALKFVFKKGQVTCESSPVDVTPDGTTGAFTAVVPRGDCDESLFDGSDVTFDVLLDDALIAEDQAVHPVPYAKYADHTGSPDCPVAYVRSLEPADTANGIIVCTKGVDEVVKVGFGSSAFWIDRYEATVWSDAEGTLGVGGTNEHFGATGDNYPTSFPNNGQGNAAGLLFALSKTGLTPSRYLTWFQATQACLRGGKRLPRNAEWQEAAAGTNDPGGCVVRATEPRDTGDGSACASAWGAQDMIGNLWEWTQEWEVGVSTTHGPIGEWPGGDYNRDNTWNIGSGAWDTTIPDWVPGVPAAGLRGGNWHYADQAGVFAMHFGFTPSSSDKSLGFRCVVSR